MKRLATFGELSGLSPMGGVRVPVARRGSHPAHGRLRGEAEHVGDDSWGHLAGELEQHGGADRPGPDAKPVEAQLQSVSAEGLARTGAGEEPRAVVGSEGGAAGASGGKLAYEPAHRFGQFDGGSAQLQRGASTPGRAPQRCSSSWTASW